MTTLAEVLEFKGFQGWSTNGDTLVSWDAGEAGRGRPTDPEIATWAAEYDAQNGDETLADRRRDRRMGRELDDAKAMRALVFWLAGKLGITPATARSEIVAIYRSLP